jgi:hypothetical protein
MHQEKEMKDWNREISELKEKIIKRQDENKTDKENLIREIRGYLDDEIDSIRNKLLKLFFTDNKKHLSHVSNFDLSQDHPLIFWYGAWKIFLNDSEVSILEVYLSGNKSEDDLMRMPSHIHLSMPMGSFNAVVHDVSINGLYFLFDEWLKEISRRIMIKGAETLNLKFELKMP